MGLFDDLPQASNAAPATESGADLFADVPFVAARESEFQKWYGDQAGRLGLNTNPDAPEHFYDYRAAWQAGAKPDESGHWPSRFKLTGHPRMVVDGVNTKTGERMAPSNDLFGDVPMAGTVPYDRFESELWQGQAPSWTERIGMGMARLREQLSPLIGETGTEIKRAKAALGEPIDMEDEAFLQKYPMRQLQQHGFFPSLWQWATKSRVQLPRLEGADVNFLLPEGTPKAVGQVVAGAQRGVVGAMDFFLTPAGVATLGMGGLPRMAQRSVAGLFAWEMGRQTPKIAEELGKAYAEGDVERSTELAVSGGLNTLFAAGSGAHALAPTRPPGLVLGLDLGREVKGTRLARPAEFRSAGLVETGVPAERLGVEVDWFGDLPEKVGITQRVPTAPTTLRPTDLPEPEKLLGTMTPEEAIKEGVDRGDYYRSVGEAFRQGKINEEEFKVRMEVAANAALWPSFQIGGNVYVVGQYRGPAKVTGHGVGWTEVELPDGRRARQSNDILNDLDEYYVRHPELKPVKKQEGTIGHEISQQQTELLGRGPGGAAAAVEQTATVPGEQLAGGESRFHREREAGPGTGQAGTVKGETQLVQEIKAAYEQVGAMEQRIAIRQNQMDRLGDRKDQVGRRNWRDLAEEQEKDRVEVDKRRSALRGLESQLGTAGGLGRGSVGMPAAGGGGVVSTPTPKSGVPATPAPVYPGGPGRALLFNQRLPVQLRAGTVRRVSVPQVMRGLEGIVQAAGGTAPIRVGRFFERAAGIFKIFPEVARIRQADNIPTATHEVAHALQKALYGAVAAKGLKGLPPGVKRELVGLGKALYGPRKPAGGYRSEGWAEFIRHYVTTEEAGKLAPATLRFFEGEVLAKNPAVAKAIGNAKDLVSVYRAQGSVARARAQMREAPGLMTRVAKVVRDFVSSRAQVDEFEPLWRLSEMYAARAGRRLAKSADPFLLATWRRGTAGAVVDNMVERGMQDIWGNPTGAKGLQDALGPVKNRRGDFTLYVWGRAAVERWQQGKNPGITLEDAMYIVDRLKSPEFELAASNYYAWNDGLLDYLGQANPALLPLIEAIRKANENYAPLARVVDPKEASAAAAMARANPLYRMRGSGRMVKDIFETTVENASRLVSLAHRHQVLEAVVKLSKAEGMGFLVEEVPRDRVGHRLGFEQIRQQLEEMGVDTSAVNADAVLSFFTPAETPRGVDPIVVVREADGPHWYQVAPGVYETLNGLQVPRLAPMLDLILGVPARALRLGTTGLRPSFSLMTNPSRDVQTFAAQTVSHANPARLAAKYFEGLGGVVRAGLGGKVSEGVGAFYRLGAHLGQPLGMDISYTKRAAKGLFRGRFMRIVTNPVDHLRELLSLTEAAPRVAELMLVGEEMGWKPGQPMTPDQAVAMAVAAKRVTVDFSAAGRVSKVLNQAIPFYGPSIQGTRSFLRTLRERPARAVLVGLSTFTAPALVNWWLNKDEDWYRELPWRERYLYTNIGDGENVWQIPRPFEWGNLFQVLPESILDSWYRRDPEGLTAAIGHIFQTTNPLDWPVLLAAGKEQWQNRIDFFDRPIVPRSQIDLPPGDQRGPYTSRLAEWLGNAFPDQLSPRRIDAGLRAYFGGVAPDLQDALGLGARKAERDAEWADVPVFGRLSRRGGEFSAQNRALADFYDDYTYYQSRYQGWHRALRNAQGPGAGVRQLTPQELGYWKNLEKTQVIMRLTQDMAHRTGDLRARQAMYRQMAAEARRILAIRAELGVER